MVAKNYQLKIIFLEDVLNLAWGGGGLHGISKCAVIIIIESSFTYISLPIKELYFMIYKGKSTQLFLI